MSGPTPTPLTDLWWHLTDAHGLNADGIHGDPNLMHAAAHSFPGVADHIHVQEDDRG